MAGQKVDELILNDETPNDQPILMLAHDPTCKVCAKMAPEFVKFAQAVEKDKIPVNLVSVNIGQQPEKVEQMHLEDGIPAIRLYRGNNHYTEYGKEEYSHFKQWAHKDFLQYLTENNVPTKAKK